MVETVVKVFNNLTRSKEIFTPLRDGEVKFYSCGPTTYDFIHVGNARALVVGDLIHRTFKALGYKVTFVRNFTDVDDKIINRAKDLNVDPLSHSAKYVNECLVDIKSLNLLPATHMPKVSETIPEIVEMVKTLVDKGFAYEVQGEVFYHVPNFHGYGKLSKKDLDSLEHGIRVEVDDVKKHPSDFVLWKPAKEGEPSWDSPWGKGRPGWHIECSAMAKKFLGETIDIHHGGIDLMFPHHENEIAQSEAANGREFSKNWCHNEFLNFGKEKMSKSLGNVVTIRQFVEKFGGEILRQMLCSVHYRSTMDWTDEAIEKGINDVERIHNFLKHYDEAKKLNYVQNDPSEFLSEIEQVISSMKADIANDFNVPGALGHFFTIIRTLNREFLSENRDFSEKKKLSKHLVNAIDEVIFFTSQATGLIHHDVERVLDRLNEAKGYLSNMPNKMKKDDIEKLIEERKEARKLKNWRRADEIRDIFKVAGVLLKDNPDGSVSWSYK